MLVRVCCGLLRCVVVVDMSWFVLHCCRKHSARSAPAPRLRRARSIAGMSAGQPLALWLDEGLRPNAACAPRAGVDVDDWYLDASGAPCRRRIVLRGRLIGCYMDGMERNKQLRAKGTAAHLPCHLCAVRATLTASAVDKKEVRRIQGYAQPTPFDYLSPINGPASATDRRLCFTDQCAMSCPPMPAVERLGCVWAASCRTCCMLKRAQC